MFLSHQRGPKPRKAVNFSSLNRPIQISGRRYQNLAGTAMSRMNAGLVWPLLGRLQAPTRGKVAPTLAKKVALWFGGGLWTGTVQTIADSLIRPADSMA